MIIHEHKPSMNYCVKGPVSKGFYLQDMAEMEYNMFSLVEHEPFISTHAADPLPQCPPLSHGVSKGSPE